MAGAGDSADEFVVRRHGTAETPDAVGYIPVFEVHHGGQLVRRGGVGVGFEGWAQLTNEPPLLDATVAGRVALAVDRLNVQRIEADIRAGSVAAVPESERPAEMLNDDDDVARLITLASQKTCSYQRPDDTGDLWCLAAGPRDATVPGTPRMRGEPPPVLRAELPLGAPTTLRACLGCELPDSDVACSHLVHPDVQGDLTSGQQPAGVRRLVGALCNLGKPGAREEPSRCRPGGHVCWERICVAEPVTTLRAVTPHALHEGLDNLNNAWRAALRTNDRLVEGKAFGLIGRLSESSHTRADLLSRLADLSTMFDWFGVPALPTRHYPEQARTLERLQIYLVDVLTAGGSLPEDVERILSAVADLRRVHGLRNVLVHASQRREAERTFRELHLPYPPADWEGVWVHVQAVTITALASIAETLGRL